MIDKLFVLGTVNDFPLDVSEFVTYDDFIALMDNISIIILKLNELVTLTHLIFVVSIGIIITLVIYFTLKKFFY